MGNQNSKLTSQDKAILEMKLQRDKLRQYQKKIVLILDRETAIARQCLKKGDKQRSLLALRQKKYQQSMLEKTDEQLMILEQLTSSIEFALVEKDVLYGLTQGNQVLRSLQKEMSLEKVEKIMDETSDAIAYQEEMAQMLSQVITSSEEEEILEEYERLQRETLPQMPEVPKTLILPQAPNHAVEQDEQVEEIRNPQYA